MMEKQAAYDTPFELSELDDPTRFSTYLSKCLLLAGKSETNVRIYRQSAKLLELLYGFVNGIKPIFSGSAVDGSELEGSDLDIMVVLPHFRVYMPNSNELPNQSSAKVRWISQTSGICYLIADVSNTRGGFTRLLGPSGCCLSSKDFFEYFGKDRNQATNRTVIPRTMSSSGNRPGPSMIYETRFTVTDDKMTTDSVYALRCTNWPLSAHEWFTRKRQYNWPTAQLVNDLRKTSCVVIPVGDEDSDFCSLEWKYAFPFAERELMWQFNNTQLQCYILLKILNNTQLKKLHIGEISTFHIKMLMFWECENTPSEFWIEENLINSVCHCLKQLKLKVKSRELLHYFIKDRNTFFTKLKNAKIQEKIVRKIEAVENDIVCSLWQCIVKYPTLRLGVITHKVISQMPNKCMAFQTALSCDEKRNFNVLFTRKMALISNPILSKNKFQLLRINLHHLESIGSSNDIFVEFLKLLQLFVEIKIGSRLISETSSGSTCKIERAILMNVAKDCFEKGIKMDDMAGKLYLATFHMYCEETQLAKDVILSCFSEDKTLFYSGGCVLPDGISVHRGQSNIERFKTVEEKPIHIALDVIFDQSDLTIVPEAIKYRLCTMNKEEMLFIHPLVYAKFLLFLLYFESEDTRTRECFNELKSAIEISMTVQDVHLKVPMLNLLAYCYHKLGLVSEAILLYLDSWKYCNNPEMNSAIYHLIYILISKLQN